MTGLCIRENCENKRRGLSGHYKWFDGRRWIKAKYKSKPQAFAVWCTEHIKECK